MAQNKFDTSIGFSKQLYIFTTSLAPQLRLGNKIRNSDITVIIQTNEHTSTWSWIHEYKLEQYPSTQLRSTELISLTSILSIKRNVCYCMLMRFGVSCHFFAAIYWYKHHKTNKLLSIKANTIQWVVPLKYILKFQCHNLWMRLYLEVVCISFLSYCYDKVPEK
jgi:hypothetical protein